MGATPPKLVLAGSTTFIAIPARNPGVDGVAALLKDAKPRGRSEVLPARNRMNVARKRLV